MLPVPAPRTLKKKTPPTPAPRSEVSLMSARGAASNTMKKKTPPKRASDSPKSTNKKSQNKNPLLHFKFPPAPKTLYGPPNFPPPRGPPPK